MFNNVSSIFKLLGSVWQARGSIEIPRISLSIGDVVCMYMCYLIAVNKGSVMLAMMLGAGDGLVKWIFGG